MSIPSGWLCQRLGGDAVIRNRNPVQARGALCSVSGGGGGEKGKLGAEL